MATYYAQGSGVIDEVEWDTTAGGGGTDLVWANLDPADILVANGKAITIDLSFTCAKISTLAYDGTVGGGFTVTAACTVTADLEYGSAGGNTCLTTSGTGYAFTLTGDVLASTAGVANKYGLHIVSALTSVTINGDVKGGASTSNHAVYNTQTTPITLNGSATPGTGTGAYGINSAGPVNVSGGTVSGGNAYNKYGILCSHANGVTLTDCILDHSTAGPPIVGKVTYAAQSDNYIKFNKSGGGTVNFAPEPAAADVQSAVVVGTVTGTFTAPAVGDVVDGVKYGGAGTEYEGTFAVPAEEDVESGVGYGENGTEYEGTLVAGGGGSVIGSSIIRRAA